MNDRTDELRFTASQIADESRLTATQMIRRAARASRRMTMEERIELIKYSEGEAERVKARFTEHWRSCQAPNAAD